MSQSKHRDAERGEVEVGPTSSPPKPKWRGFAGPRGAQAPLRVAIDRRANAELVAHAKDLLEVEVCGVLVGQVCEDDEGPWVHVEAVIRGNAAAQAATHVTFTQATWDAIHSALERDHPKRRIVGWYHTHPGFGVEFSEMDVFIQRNFFSGPTQIALVTDPTNGAVAIAIAAESGITYLPRYWVDGREQSARGPAAAYAAASAAPAGGETTAPPGELAQVVKSLEARVSQLIQSHDDQRALFHQVVLMTGMVFCTALLATAGYLIYQSYKAPLEPPRGLSFAPVPVKLGNSTVLLGVGVLSWRVPPELDAIMLEMEQRQRDAEAKAAAEAAKAAGAASAKTPANEPPKPETPHD